MKDSKVMEMVELARKNLIYMSCGEWDGNPETLEDVSLEFLIEMKTLCDLCISEKLSKQY